MVTARLTTTWPGLFQTTTVKLGKRTNFLLIHLAVPLFTYQAWEAVPVSLIYVIKILYLGPMIIISHLHRMMEVLGQTHLELLTTMTTPCQQNIIRWTY